MHHAVMSSSLTTPPPSTHTLISLLPSVNDVHTATVSHSSSPNFKPTKYSFERNGREPTPTASLTSTHATPITQTGHRWQGEAFEEMVSYKGAVPSLRQRTCTQSLKIWTTTEFLRDWLTLSNTIPQLGCPATHMTPESEYAHHLKKGGRVPKEIFVAKKQYLWNQPTLRPEQHYQNYDRNYHPFQNPHVPYRQYGGKPMFGKGGLEYVSCIGLRADEPQRTKKIEVRNNIPCGYEGEHAYLPLDQLDITTEDVSQYWQAQDFDLELPTNSSQSNCVYCFLKGVSTLQNIYQTLSLDPVEGYGELTGTPSDIEWWSNIEHHYRRDLKAENRPPMKGLQYVSFFGNRHHTYQDLKGELNQGLFQDLPLPCDCTD